MNSKSSSCWVVLSLVNYPTYRTLDQGEGIGMTSLCCSEFASFDFFRPRIRVAAVFIDGYRNGSLAPGQFGQPKIRFNVAARARRDDAGPFLCFVLSSSLPPLQRRSNELRSGPLGKGCWRQIVCHDLVIAPTDEWGTRSGNLAKLRALNGSLIFTSHIPCGHVRCLFVPESRISSIFEPLSSARTDPE